MARFTLPRDLYYGPGAIDELKNLKGHKKAIIVTGGSSMKRGGFLQKVEDVLHSVDIETQLFEGVEPDPSIETVFKGAKAMQEFEPDIIVSIGGGSPIDAAKAMWVFYEYPCLLYTSSSVIPPSMCSAAASPLQSGRLHFLRMARRVCPVR